MNAERERIEQLRAIFDRYAMTQSVQYAYVQKGGHQVGGTTDQKVLDFTMFTIAASEVMRLPDHVPEVQSK